ncbi:MAG TPA: CPBP family intramembrane glutamic endopeptidase [Oculatellaceae cyanobacterium]
MEVAVFLLLAKLLKLPQAVSALSFPKNLRCIVVALLVGALFAVIDGLGHPVSRETQVYEWTMPGLSEEIVFRGVMLGVLDQRLGRPWKILGVRMGLGAVITSLIFCLAHALVIDRDWTLHFDNSGIFELLCFGFAMCWLRYRYNSVVPAIVAHNVSNGLPCVL